MVGREDKLKIGMIAKTVISYIYKIIKIVRSARDWLPAAMGRISTRMERVSTYMAVLEEIPDRSEPVSNISRCRGHRASSELATIKDQLSF